MSHSAQPISDYDANAGWNRALGRLPEAGPNANWRRLRAVAEALQ